VAGDDEHPFTMGLSAAKEALADAGIQGEDLDLVIFVSGGDYDYRNWCPSSAVAHALGCSHAYAFEVRNGCAGGNLACHIAGGLMERDASIVNALVICADTLSRRSCPPNWRRATRGSTSVTESPPSCSSATIRAISS
jgi:3-oxoacyl-[acyl-carrier-protein] synthase-3